MAKKKAGKPYIETTDLMVMVDGLKFKGFLYRVRCPECRRITILSETHDSIFCPMCDIWLEQACMDPDCEFCPERPPFPLATGIQADVSLELLKVKRQKRIEANQRKWQRLTFAKGHRSNRD